MVNRMKWLFDELDGREAPESFYAVTGECGWFVVSKDTAERLMALMDRPIRPRWLKFRDAFGSCVRVRTREVTCVYESTPDQRSRERSFRRARKDEARDDDEIPGLDV